MLAENTSKKQLSMAVTVIMNVIYTLYNNERRINILSKWINQDDFTISKNSNNILNMKTPSKWYKVWYKVDY